MSTTLSFLDGEFVEGNKKGENVMAHLEINEANETAKLTFSGDANLVTRRIASRQAESVCKTGFQKDDGERIGIGCELEVIEGDKLSEAHTREGYRYNRI